MLLAIFSHFYLFQVSAGCWKYSVFGIRSIGYYQILFELVNSTLTPLGQVWMPLYGAREEWRRSFSPCFFDFFLDFLFICSQSGNGLNWFCLLVSIGTFLLAIFISDEKDNDRLFRAVFYSRHSFGFDYLTTYQREVSEAPNHTFQTAIWFPVGSTIPYSVIEWWNLSVILFFREKMGAT